MLKRVNTNRSIALKHPAYSIDPNAIEPNNAMECFDKIYYVMHSDKMKQEHLAHYYLYLEKKYRLDYWEIEVIAELMHSPENQINDDQVAVIGNVWELDFCCDFLRSLQARNFIEISDDWSHFSLTDVARLSFINNIDFYGTIYVDCYNELKECSIYDMTTPNWLQAFVSSFGLPQNEQFRSAYELLGLSELQPMVLLTFWYVAQIFIHNYTDTFCEEDCKINVENRSECLRTLINDGLVNTIQIEDDSKVSSEYILSPKAAKLLFYGHNELIKYDEITKYADLIKSKDIEKKNLFYNDDAKKEIDAIRTMISPDGFLRAKRILSEKKRPQAIQSLLWGPPGTGKTESVKQLALESGRDIIIFDTSKVFASNWGASEKLHRQLFRAYKYLAAISSNVPILLLNEADAMLSKRLYCIERSIDKSENIISNILLEELESMDGILLATTNLIDNIDSAFERRFLFKTQLINPDKTVRAKIWKSSIPELTEEEINTLSERFEMTGAQISNVITKRDLAELYFDGDRGFKYIEQLCQKEILTKNRPQSSYKRIGFH